MPESRDPITRSRVGRSRRLLVVLGATATALVVIAVVVTVLISTWNPPTDVWISAVNSKWELSLTVNNSSGAQTIPYTFTVVTNWFRNFQEGRAFTDAISVPISPPSYCSYSFNLTIYVITLKTVGFSLKSMHPSLPLTTTNGTVYLSPTVIAPTYSYAGTLDFLVSGSAECKG